MKITVKISKLLNSFFPTSSFDLEVSSYNDIISACVHLFPAVKKNFLNNKLSSQITLLDGDKYVRNYEMSFSPKNDTIYLVPTVSGGVDNAFDSLGNLSIFYGTSSAISSQVVDLTAMNKRIRDSSLFGQSQTAFDIAQRKINRDSGVLENAEDPTRGFGSLATINAIGQPIPLHFGLVRTSGVLISQYIKHIQRGGIDNIKVSDYV